MFSICISRELKIMWFLWVPALNQSLLFASKEIVTRQRDVSVGYYPTGTGRNAWGCWSKACSSQSLSPPAGVKRNECLPPNLDFYGWRCATATDLPHSTLDGRIVNVVSLIYSASFSFQTILENLKFQKANKKYHSSIIKFKKKSMKMINIHKHAGQHIFLDSDEINDYQFTKLNVKATMSWEFLEEIKDWFEL